MVETPRPGDGLTVRLGREVAHVPSVVLAFALGAAGGWVAKAIGTPLPWLLGSLIVVTTAALIGVRPFGHVLGAPTIVRTCFIPVIGVSIGAAFTPGLFGQAAAWWPTLLALFLYIPLAHAIGVLTAVRIGGADLPTAYYGTMPGGFVESIALGESVSADPALLATLQFLRLVLCIVMIPLGFTVATGHAVGSASGAVIGGSDPLSAADWAILFVAGLLGGVGGKRLNIPAGIIMGPILLSGLLHLLGLVEGGPPRWLVDATQLVLGVTLGSRFAGRSPRILLTGLRVTLVSVPATLLLAAAFAAALHGVVGERWEAVFLAFSPGGLVEMALIALSLEISVIYVTAHHVIRIMLAVFTARLLQGRVLR